MDKKELALKYWNAPTPTDLEELKQFFHAEAVVNWPNTSESFSLEEYLIVNSEYPGNWQGEIERTEAIGDLVVIAARFREIDTGESHHAVWFFNYQGDKIMRLDEYWGEDCDPPQWRIEKLGKSSDRR